MKPPTLWLAIAFSVFATVANAACEGRPSNVKLEVVVTGAKPPRGQAAITVYPDKPRRFLAPGGKLARVRAPLRGTDVSACFWLPAPGAYAVAVYHDVNADHDFNRSLIGMPTEGFGFSNDAPTKIGLPKFEAVRFRVKPGDNRITVKLRYLN